MVRISTVFLAIVLSAPLALAQRHSLTAISPDAPEGRMLQQIQQELDTATQLSLLEQFAAQYPKNENIAWVYDQLIAAYAKAGQSDKVLETGQKLLAIDAGDVATAQQCLKAAEAKKDPELVLKWSVTASDAARKVLKSPPVSGARKISACCASWGTVTNIPSSRASRDQVSTRVNHSAGGGLVAPRRKATINT